MNTAMLAAVAGQTLAAPSVSVDVVSSDFTGTTHGASTTITTLSHTCAASATALLVCVMSSGHAGPTFTAKYNGVSMTQVGATSTELGLAIAWFVMTNPPSGAHNITAFSSVTGQEGYVVGVSLFNCTTVGDFQGVSVASSSSQSVSTPSSSTGLVVSAAGIFAIQTFTTPSGSTIIANGTHSARGIVCTQPGTGSSVTSAYSVGSNGQFSVASVNCH